MNDTDEGMTYPLEEALRAQKALRDLAGMEPEKFPMAAFVGMISDEIEELRKRGHDDEAIAKVIRNNSAIQIEGADIVKNYAPPEARQSSWE